MSDGFEKKCGCKLLRHPVKNKTVICVKYEISYSTL